MNKVRLLRHITLFALILSAAMPGTVYATAPPPVINRTALAGQTINVMNYTSVNPDCTAADPVTIHVKQQPSYGKATVSQSETFPNYPMTNPRFACNRMKFPSSLVQYQAPTNFTGTDIMTVELFTASGGDNEIKILITVK